MISNKHRTSYIFDATISTCSIHWPQPNRASWDTSHSKSQHAKHEVRQVEVKVGVGEVRLARPSPPRLPPCWPPRRGKIWCPLYCLAAALGGRAVLELSFTNVDFQAIFRFEVIPTLFTLESFHLNNLSWSSSASSTETSCWDSPAAGASFLFKNFFLHYKTSKQAWLKNKFSMMKKFESHSLSTFDHVHYAPSNYSKSHFYMIQKSEI